MHFYGCSRKKIGLRLLTGKETAVAEGMTPGYTVSGTKHGARFSGLMSGAARMMFEMKEGPERAAARRKKVLPAVFQDQQTGHLRSVYKEAVLRFQPGTSAAMQRKILKKHGFKVREQNRYVEDQYVVYHPKRGCVGADLIPVANDWAEMDEIVFAAPNFVSEYRRAAVTDVHEDQWHLVNRALYVGQKLSEDINARQVWKKTRGKRSIVIAILDDGVDTDHPNLKTRILKNPDPTDKKDKFGRDFFVSPSSPDHHDPRPKVFTYPYEDMDGNDIHGTPCAGVAAATGSRAKVRGAAPLCRILPVKIFHASEIASDARVADAIRYAARCADIISCSWGGPRSPDVELAIEDAGAGRKGKGAAVFCAAGNDGRKRVDYPAAYLHAIAVGASTDKRRLARYSNTGKQVSVVAPSSGGVLDIYTTDVSTKNRGFNLGNEETGGKNGLFTNEFGGTSSATPLAAGVAGLVLSVHPGLTREELKGVLESTADKIGSGYKKGHSKRYGYGRVNASAAVRKAAAMRKKSKKKSKKKN